MRRKMHNRIAVAVRPQSGLLALAILLALALTIVLNMRAALGADEERRHPSAEEWASMSESQRESLRKEVMERMRTMRMWRMTEELKLDEKQAAKIFPLLARMDAKDLEVAKQKVATMKAIREALDGPKHDDKALSRLASTMVDLRAKQNTQEIEKLKALRKLLNPEQQARMVLLVPRLEREFHRHIRNAVGARFSDKGHSHRHRKRFPDRDPDR